MSKRALIVDDSRSARVILSRMLEGYGLAVDSTESAEQALEFLKHASPDVIFMDHLMPGMDGFQAVQAIKSNPATAMIPVLMYTSQEGDLYLSQARALGAVGVLPKTVNQSDVSRVLYSLNLLPERREARAAAQAHAQPAAQAVSASGGNVVQIEPAQRGGGGFGEVETSIRAAVAPLLKEHAAEMRRFLVATLETFSRRITAEANPEAPANPPPETTPADEPPTSSRWMPALLAALLGLAVLSTLAVTLFTVRTQRTTEALLASNAELAALLRSQQEQLTALKTTLEKPAVAAAASGSVVDAMESQIVPYGEAPLAGARLDHLRELVERLKRTEFRGRIKVTSHVGEFCLTGSALEGYSMAADDLPLRRCDMIGNPFDDSLNAAQRQSLAFANLISAVRQDAGDALVIDVVHAGRSPATAYPDPDRLPKPTAGEWNKAAAQNNRVEFVVEPAGV